MNITLTDDELNYLGLFAEAADQVAASESYDEAMAISKKLHSTLSASNSGSGRVTFVTVVSVVHYHKKCCHPEGRTPEERSLVEALADSEEGKRLIENLDGLRRALLP